MMFFPGKDKPDSVAKIKGMIGHTSPDQSLVLMIEKK
jgi:hypothetical protein